MELNQQPEVSPAALVSSVPRLTGGWPLFGHLREFQRDPVALLSQGVAEKGDLYQFKLGPKNFALFSGPDAHDAFFSAPDDQLDPKSVYRFTVPIFGRGVAYDVEPEIMTEQLGFLFPALRQSNMTRFASIMFDEAALFADEMGDEGELNLPTAMNELTVKIASRCFLGEETRREVDEGFAAAYHELQNGINTIGFFFPRLPIPAHRRRDRARAKVVEIFSRIMAERRETGAEFDDFMDALMHAHYKNGRALTDDEISGILLTALFAGQHTSAVLATWTGLEMIRASSFLERARSEMRDVHSASAVMTLDSLNQQQLMENAVREGERLHPPLILLIRKVARELSYRGHVVPQGTLAMVSPAVSHGLADVFENPERFDPDRFSAPRSEEKQHPYALIGFGGGKHRCMGKNFAIMQIKALWTVLFDRFDFSLPSSFPEPNYGSWVTGPVEPCRVRYKRRKQGQVFHH